MALVAPLKGVRYDPDVAGTLEDIVTPPYDIISKNEEASYVSRSPYNIIRLDITKEPGREKTEDGNRYKSSADLFQHWLHDGVLLRDREPSFYPYDITYKRADGSSGLRRGFICLVQVSPFSHGDVKPHEQTFDSVIADRLALTKQCRAQFSQVFSLYSDPRNEVITALDEAANSTIAKLSDGDGNIHELRKIADRETIGRVQTLFEQKSLYIADGHHRYTTALAYQNALAAAGPLAADRPENFIMMYLSPMEDRGLSILPTHRMVTFPGQISVSELLERLQRSFEVEELVGGSREGMINELLARLDEKQSTAAKKNNCFGFYHPGEDRGFLLSFADSPKKVVAVHPADIEELDVVVFSDRIISEVLHLDEKQCEQENLILFHSDTSYLLDVSVKQASMNGTSTPLLFLLNPTRVGQVKNVSDRGHVMPHKSTYFYPKIISGLVLNMLLEDEKIVVPR
ncbi:MAG: DUF1015 domain-containing protein [Desulfocapsaceae bacterium]|jgi:uncharacterized protein (DUF1015 family)|nr:DUF1015 domain-containing protein [Desulfocapsaceae bacterium]